MNNFDKKRDYIPFSIFFSIWFFLSFDCDMISVHLITNNKINQGLNMYVLSALFSSFGVFLYYLLKQNIFRIKNINRFISIIYITVLTTISILNIFFIESLYPLVFIILGLFVGFNLGFILNILYIKRIDNKPIGIISGISLALGTITRYIFLLIIPEHNSNFLYINLALVIVISFTMWYILIFKIKNVFLEIPISKEVVESKKINYMRLLRTIASISSIFSFLIGANDNLILKGLIETNNSNLVLAEFFYIPGLIIAGVITDIKKGRFLPIACLCNICLLIPTILFLKYPSTFLLNSGMAYFAGGFFLIYIYISFLAVAERTKNPNFYICLSGMLFGLFCSVGAITMEYLFALSEIALISIYSLLIVLFFILFLLSGSVQIFEEKSILVSEQDDYSNFILKYHLTERESQVFQYLITGMSAIDIGEKLFITERTVRHHITNIYAKTGTKSRIELFMLVKK